MYTDINFKSKKALKEAVAAFNAQDATEKVAGKNAVTYFQPGPFAGNEPVNGTIFCEGPHYPEPHRWYAQCEVASGVIVKVK
jgi:hypothetical protein